MLAAGAVVAEAAWFQPRRVSESRIRVGASDGPDPPLRLSLLMDLHLDEVGEFEADVARAVAEAAPDAVVLGGDVVDHGGGLDLTREFLGLLPPGVPVIATLGNWEYWSDVGTPALRRMYDRAGAVLLVNEEIELRSDARLVGVDDVLAGTPTMPRGRADDPRRPLVVSHCPVWRDGLGGEVAAVVAGHTHGGQITLAGWAPARPPGSGSYVSGWYRDADGARPDLYVSRGIGTSLVPVRFGAVPEVVHVDWSPEVR